ncbi:3-methyladenine DNA glycosylase AlkC [Metabacillus crassostreae]|uniref:DNA alkylation repair protein n=1 Tax=Metabacillus crassostreae TaxID=929098 RepID=UPI00195B0A87|nr:DNA alkylation repair protein [Metabacillus crassostreae]MBM7605905.1 3-methyladenine DNA glycosylase AlkC [Metabacillus crassostreae]
MAEELRNIYNEQFIKSLSTFIKEEYQNFDCTLFESLIYDDSWNELPLKRRMRHITSCLYETLPKDYDEAIAILRAVAPRVNDSLAGIIFPDYVEVYGLEKWNLSMDALEFFTKYSTSEFAVRAFVIKNQSAMIEQFLIWSRSDNEHVRRLASEGSRPRLPWGISLVNLKQDPSPILPILENLKEDTSLYVRKSVANNLNDISKDHPDAVIKIAENWNGQKEVTNWIIKKGLRTLLKKGNEQALELVGIKRNENIHVLNFTVGQTEVKIGDYFSYSFDLQSNDNQSRKIRIEYIINYVKANGKLSPKQFKISEIILSPGELKSYKRNHNFKDLSTRKHYPGKHAVSVIINGEVKATAEFSVISM